MIAEVLQQKWLRPPAAEAERDRRAVVAGGVGALPQRLIGGGEIVVAGRVHRVGGDGLGQRLCGQPMIAGCPIQQAHDVQRRRLARLDGKDLLAQHFRVERAALLNGKRCFGGKLGQVRSRWRLAAR